MASVLSPSGLSINSYKRGGLGNSISRYRINVVTGTKFDLIVTLTGSNWSLGTTDRRYLRCYIGRRYAGHSTITELEGNGARFAGSFASSGVGVIIEQSNSSSFIMQVHNSYSQGPSSGFTSHYEMFSGGDAPYSIETYTGSNYTSNPF